MCENYQIVNFNNIFILLLIKNYTFKLQIFIFRSVLCLQIFPIWYFYIKYSITFHVQKYKNVENPSFCMNNIQAFVDSINAADAQN